MLFCGGMGNPVDARRDAASSAVSGRSVWRVDAGARAAAHDAVAVEAALEVRVNGAPFSVIMRTPGADRDLTAGFLLSEGIVAGRDDLVEIRERGDGASVDVHLAASVPVADLLRARRQVTMNSSCGMCGRVDVASLDRALPPVNASWTVPASVIAGLPIRLRTAQRAFAETGGLHAAGLFDRRGELLASAEDVGRHNAVDKLIGRAWLAGDLPLHDRMMCVSGRLSFELVQKALIAGIPLLAAVSAPSSLAIDLAVDGGMTLAGFVRDGRFNIYAHPQRIDADAGQI